MAGQQGRASRRGFQAANLSGMLVWLRRFYSGLCVRSPPESRASRERSRERGERGERNFDLPLYFSDPPGLGDTSCNIDMRGDIVWDFGYRNVDPYGEINVTLSWF